MVMGFMVNSQEVKMKKPKPPMEVNLKTMYGTLLDIHSNGSKAILKRKRELLYICDRLKNIKIALLRRTLTLSPNEYDIFQPAFEESCILFSELERLKS